MQRYHPWRSQSWRSPGRKSSGGIRIPPSPITGSTITPATRFGRDLMGQQDILYVLQGSRPHAPAPPRHEGRAVRVRVGREDVAAHEGHHVGAHPGLEGARGLAAVGQAEVLAIEAQDDGPAGSATHDAQRGLVGLGTRGQEHDAVDALRAGCEQALRELHPLVAVARARPTGDTLVRRAAVTASTHLGVQLPTLLVPQPAPKSMKRFPSTSSMSEPSDCWR